MFLGHGNRSKVKVTRQNVHFVDITDLEEVVGTDNADPLPKPLHHVISNLEQAAVIMPAESLFAYTDLDGRAIPDCEQSHLLSY